MDKYLEKVKKYIEENKMIRPGEILVLGVSGGPDSMCLFHMLYELFGNSNIIKVVHVNHGLRENAVKEAAFVKKYCEEHGIECIVIAENIKELADRKNMSVEEAGRYIRYQSFSDALGDNKGRIVVAHNMNDNAETVLFNMFRGSSLTGISGIKNKNDNIIRPLLCLRRFEIEEYINNNNIPYCIDESNLEDDYSRNVIRHHILPLAEQRLNDNTVGNIFSLSQDVISAMDYMEIQVEQAFKEYIVLENNQLVVKKELLMLHKYLISLVLYKAIVLVSGKMKDIERKHVNLVIELFGKQVGHALNLPYMIIAKRCYQGVLLMHGESESAVSYEGTLLDNQGNSMDKSFKIKIFDYDKNVIIPEDKYTKWFDYDIISAAPCVRSRKEGDYLIVNDRGESQKLKKYFVNEKIPSNIRDNIKLICDGSHVMWVVGYRMSHGYKVTSSTRRVIEISYDCEG